MWTRVARTANGPCPPLCPPTPDEAARDNCNTPPRSTAAFAALGTVRTRAALESDAEERRRTTPAFASYPGAKCKLTPSIISRFGLQQRDSQFNKASEAVVDYAANYVYAHDRGIPFTEGSPDSLLTICQSKLGLLHFHYRVGKLVVRSVSLKIKGGIQVLLRAIGVPERSVLYWLLDFLVPSPHAVVDIFAPYGAVAAKIKSEKQRRAFKKRQSDLSDQIIRSRTVYHNGCIQSQMKLPPQLLPPGSVKVDAKTRFECAAQKYTPPTDEEIAAKASKKTSTNTHPRLASARYQHVVKLRKLAASLNYEQYDPCISSNSRDEGAYGDRPIHQVKDLANCPVPRQEASEHAEDNDAQKTTKRVVTLIDCLTYADSLREYSGEDIIAWTGFYPSLAGSTDESVYYADSESTFTEVIGTDAVSGAWENQLAWDFTRNDIVYIENLDRSAFTVYKVYRHTHPELLKQTVFLCATLTVNLPYAVVDDLTLWTKGHHLSSSGIGTPGLAKNITLVPRDPQRPWTQDILVMHCGTPEIPVVQIKYKDAIGPKSAATMSEEVYHWIKYQHSGSGRGLTTHEAIKRVEMYASEDETAYAPGAAAYCELLRTVAWWGDLPCVIYYDVRKYGDEPPTEAEKAKAVMATPKLTQNKPCVLAATPDAMKAYKKEKMEGLVNDTVPTPDWEKITDLCLKHFIRGIETESGTKKGSLQLISRDKVRESRTRAQQRARQETDAIGPSPKDLGRVENKIEAAHKTAACPRGVQNPDYDISELSGVLAKSLEPIISKLRFYDPGRTPREIAKNLQSTYLKSMDMQRHFGAGGVRSVDYTAADEKHCKLSNRFLRAIIEYFFCAEDVAEALWIYDSCFHMLLKVGDTVKSSGWKNASGTGITTLLNTIVFAMRELQTVMVALVFRSMEEDGELTAGKYVMAADGGQLPFPNVTYSKFLAHLKTIDNTWLLHKTAGSNKTKIPAMQVAYSWIGPKFGDDGVDPSTPFVSDRLYECAMKYVDRQDGFLRKLEVSDPGKEESVEYLSRIYPNLLCTLSSFCKPEKAHVKLSVATNRDRDRYVLKLKGYWENDRNTPLVGALVEATAKMYGVTMSQPTEEELAVIAETDKELYWKLSNGPFPTEEGASDFAFERVAADYGITSGELRDIDELLRTKSTWAGIQSIMVPAKLSSETAQDPLGLAETADPPGVARVGAFDCTTKGEDPRMMDFESEYNQQATFTPMTAPADPARSAAALAALGCQ